MNKDVLPIAHRVWAEPQDKKRTRRGSQHAARPLLETILFLDTETLVDHTQALTFGAYRYCRVRDNTLISVEEGLFYADDLSTTDPEGLSTMQRYVTDHTADTLRPRPLQLHTRAEFVEKVFYRAAYDCRARVVGFNLPFDLSRLAIESTDARGMNRGGFSLILSGGSTGKDGVKHRERRHRPRVVIKHRDAKGAFISFTKPMEPDDEDLIPPDSPDGKPDPTYAWPGRFLDLKTLAFTLTGESHSLDSACRAFGVPGKADPGQHGGIFEHYIDYCRQDVAATASLHHALLVEFATHPVALEAERAYSPASLSKAYLAEMGITPLLDRHGHFPRCARVRHGGVLRRSGRVSDPQDPGPGHACGLHCDVPDGRGAYGPPRPPDRRAHRGGRCHRRGREPARLGHPQ